MKEKQTKKNLSVALAAARKKDSEVPNVKQLPSASNMLMFATSGWTGDGGEQREWEGKKVCGGEGRMGGGKKTPQPSVDWPVLLVLR